MKPFGQIITLGLTPDDLVMPFLPFMLKELSIHGSVSATNEEVEATLNFAATHGVKPTIEEFSMDEQGVAAAIEKLATGNIRYRAVLTV
jgi:D-arabinose 1-dehydrogenase-like Zn-dependent alcohol dehydrogenase